MNAILYNTNEQAIRVIMISGLLILSFSLGWLLGINIQVTFFFAILFLFILTLVNSFKAAFVFYIVAGYFLPTLSQFFLLLSGQILTGGRNLLNGLPDIILGIFCFYFFVSVVFVQRRKIIFSGVDKFLVAFIVFQVVQVFNPNSSIFVGINGLRDSVFPMLLFFISREVLKKRKDLLYFFKLVAVCSILDMSYGLYQHYIKYLPWQNSYMMRFPSTRGTMIWAAVKGYSGIRKVGSFAGGSYSLQYPLAVFGVIFFSLRRYVMASFKFVLLLYAFLLVWLFSLAIERTPIMMLLLGILFLQLRFRCGAVFARSAAKIVLSVALLFASIHLGGNFLDSLGSRRYYRLSEMANPLKVKTFKGRYSVGGEVAIAFHYVRQKPFWGYGLGIGEKSRQSKLEKGFWIYPHNMFLKIWLELGLGGLLLFMVLIGKIFIELVKKYRVSRSSFEKQLSIAMFSVTIVILAAGTANIPFAYHLDVFYWPILGYCLRGDRR